MASLGRSFKPPAYLSSRGRRPNVHRAMSSTSNASSSTSSGDFDSDGVIRSSDPSPTQDSPAPVDLGKRADRVHLKLPESDGRRSARSRPIAIELPAPKRSNISSSSVYTPPAPLSARGDLPGGYFPLHEEQSRVYRNHPFHLDTSKARQRSIEAASLESSPDTQVPISAPTVPATVPEPIVMPPRRTLAPPSRASPNTANTPVASYIPSGAVASPLPLGKYYPTNYEKRKEEKRQQRLRPTSGHLPSTVKSDSQVPTYRGDSSLRSERSESEAKRRLQQYQRDMIAQASLAINGGNVNAAALNAISLRDVGFTSLTSKPSAPRLAPMGSPGPVTPMDLESRDDGYLGVRVASSADAVQAERISRAIREDQERRRREGATSPVVNVGRIF